MKIKDLLNEKDKNKVQIINVDSDEKALELISKDPFNIIYIANPSKSVQLAAKKQFESNKKNTIRQILIWFKSQDYNSVKIAIKVLRRLNLNWPELNSIDGSRKHEMTALLQKPSQLSVIPKIL